MDAICSEERNEHGERNTYEDVFGFLATQGDKYNFFMPVKAFALYCIVVIVKPILAIK